MGAVGVAAFSMKARPSRRRRMVFLEDLENHSARETCFGAAAYAAEIADLDFEPWPLLGEGSTLPRFSDFREADCIITTERACKVVFGTRRIRLPHAFVLADVDHGEMPAISLDQDAIGAMAVEHLLGRGYRNIAFVGSSGKLWSQYRGAGFLRAAKRHGIEPIQRALPKDALPVYWHSDFARRDSELLRILRELPKPCGIFAANDVIACFLIETARSYDIPIPHQIGVIGVDDDPVCNATAGMEITSIQAPFREVGREAAAQLDRLARGLPYRKRGFLSPIRVMARTSTDVFLVRDKLVRNAQAFIENHCLGPVRVGDVVKACRTTSMTLIRHFRRHLQVTPLDYILLRRMERAKELLREGSMNVGEVAAACGFHSSSYFCKMFRKTVNRPPSAFRGVSDTAKVLKNRL